METKKMTRARAWRARWARVNKLHVQEMRQMSVEERWQKLYLVFGLAQEMGWGKPAGDKELTDVRARWAKLKADYP